MAKMTKKRQKHEKSHFLLKNLKNRLKEGVYFYKEWIELVANKKTYHREITVGAEYASGSAVASHFGLGDAKKIKFRVMWPDNSQSAWQKTKINQAIMFNRKNN